MTSVGPTARGVVRLLTTAGGRVLCLAGDVDAAVVHSFRQRYGGEPAQVDGIDAGSVTRLSASALDLVLDHLAVAERAGRQVAVRRSPLVERLLAGERENAGGRPPFGWRAAPARECMDADRAPQAGRAAAPTDRGST